MEAAALAAEALVEEVQEVVGKMSLSSIIYLISSLIGLLWIASFLYNIIYFFRNEDQEIDKIFFNKDKTFEEAFEDLETLEKYLNRELLGARKKLKFYHNNALRTRRKYNYYSEYIEPGYTKIYIGSDQSFKFCWSLLDTTVKFHYAIISILFIAIGLAICGIAVILLLYSKSILIIVSLVLALAFLLKFFNFIIKLNYLLFFILIDWILIVFNQERGRLYRNLAILDVMTANFWGSDQSGILIGGAGISSFSSGGGSFGGFGGGSFGGGGAGGSW